MMVAFKFLNEAIDFDNSKEHIIVIENKKLFRDIVNSFENDYSDDYFIFSTDYKPISFSKTGYYISDIFNVDLNSRKLLTKVNSFLEENANTEFLNELDNLKSDLISLGDKLCNFVDFDCEFNYDISTSDIIKLLQFKLGKDENNPVEKLVSFMLLMKKYLKTELFVIPHLHLLFDEQELLLIKETLSLNDIILLSIECTMPNVNNTDSLSIIDSDLCLIDNNYI